MKDKLLSGLFWVLLLNLIVKPFWILGIEVGVQNAVGEETYGFYFAIFNLAYIFNILLDLGVTNFNTRNIAQHPVLISKHLPALLSIKTLLLGLYLVVTFTVALLWGYNSRQFLLLAFLTFNQFLNSLILYLRSNFQGLLLFKWDSLISVLDRVLMILICGALLWLPKHPTFKIEYFVLAQTTAYLITALLALMLLIRKTGFHRLRFNKPFTLAILKKSAPFALLVLLMASYNRLDPVLLQRFATNGDFQAGIYAGSFRLLDALTMIAYLVSVPLLPIFSKLTQKPSENLLELDSSTRLVTSLMIVFSVTTAVAFSTFNEPLMELLYKTNGSLYCPSFRILIYGIIPISFTYIFGTLLTAGGQLRGLNLLASLTLVINIAINLFAIPRWGAQGSAWASLIAQSFMAAAQVVLAMKLYRLKPSGSYLLRIVLFVVCIIVLSRLGFNSWIIHLLFMFVTSLALALILRLVDIAELIQIVKQKQEEKN